MKTFNQFIHKNKVHINGNLCHDKVFIPCSIMTEIELDEALDKLTSLGEFKINQDARQFLLENNIRPDELIRDVVGIDLTVPHKGDIEIFYRKSMNLLIVDANDVKHHKTGGFIINCNRHFNFLTKTVTHNLLVLGEDSQNANTVKEMFKDALPLYDKLGMEKITLDANMTAGGYAWAKYGFSPTINQDNMRKVKQSVDAGKKRLNDFMDKVEELGVSISKEVIAEYKLVNKFLSDSEVTPDIIANIANLKSPHLDKFIDYNKEHRDFGIDTEDNMDYIPPHINISLSKLLLYRANWTGELDLKSANRKNLETYINQ